MNNSNAPIVLRATMNLSCRRRFKVATMPFVRVDYLPSFLPNLENDFLRVGCSTACLGTNEASLMTQHLRERLSNFADRRRVARSGRSSDFMRSVQIGFCES